jgi:cation diffusion facilitator family transporter
MNIEEKPIIGRPKFHYQTNKLKKSEAGTTEKKKLIIASVISLIFMILEIVGGIISGSLSIITDAFHILSDVSSFLISLIAIWLTKKQSTDTMSFGYRRAEALGSLFSIFLIWGLTIWFIVEAIHRFMTPEPIEPLLMIIVAFVGLLFNII